MALSLHAQHVQPSVSVAVRWQEAIDLKVLTSPSFSSGADRSGRRSLRTASASDLEAPAVQWR